MEFSAQFFEEASTAWRANKISLENGMFKYKNMTESATCATYATYATCGRTPFQANLSHVMVVDQPSRTRSGKKFKKE